jgi:hypothetical protein
MSNSDAPAIPIAMDGFGQCEPVVELGLSKREYFAGLAMQGWLARCANVPHIHEINPSTVAELSVEMADNLLKSLAE